MINHKDSRFDWYVQGYYNDTVKPPRQFDGFAIEIGGVTEDALYVDILVLRKRGDIGRIILIDPNGNEEEIQ